ncbi:MAG: hypothetical protein FD138_2181 [Planctomycetota bacterium]|nr:MAG: hypothetical protein FD138_2181 [Planctomycetota bacterium]
MSSLRHVFAVGRRRVSMFVIVVLGLMSLNSILHPAIGADADLAKATPSGAVFFAEISGLEPWIEKLQNSQLVASLPSNPQVQAFYASPQGRQADAGRKLIENQLGMDLWTLAKTALGGQLAIALYPHDGRKEPDAVIAVQVKDAKALDRIRERVTPLLTLIEQQISQTTGPGNVLVRSIDGKVFIAERDNWIVAASTSDLMTRMLSLRAGASDGAKSLADDAPYMAMTKQLGSQHLVRSYVNLQLVASVMGGRLGPEKLDNPGVSLLLGGLYELANHSPFFGSTIDLDGQRFVLAHSIAGKPESLGEKYASLFAAADKPDAGSLPNVPGLIGGLILHRDFAGWYKRREELLDAKVLPEFDKFEAGLANVLPGKDYGTDILPSLGRNLTFVAAPQNYSHLNGKPGLQLPGFALVWDLAKPEEAEQTLNLFFQTVATISNLNAGQQGRQPWVLSSESYKEVQIQFGKYGQKPKGDRLPIVFNFMPAAARVRDKFVMASSVDLCKRLVDAYLTPTTTTATAKPTRNDFLFELTGESLADMLEVNRGMLEARSVAQEGKTSDQAQSDVSTLLQLVRAVRTLRLTSGAEADGYRVQLEAVWK